MHPALGIELRKKAAGITVPIETSKARRSCCWPRSYL